jgi:transglutaminase-like putative cysteine protease
MDEYLQLPGNITPRTRELASEIAAGLTTPYEIASAVTDYLRNNIEYTQSVETPPGNQERVDWFLFDYGKGFCNYYATAEVVLLRSLGIPARMSVGFAQGERETPPVPANLPPNVDPNFLRSEISETSTYIVREKDAHAWPGSFSRGWLGSF